MSRPETRVRREAREDALWAAVWQIWPEALLFEDETPFNAMLPRLRRRSAQEKRSTL